jgi:hypothetical protein
MREKAGTVVYWIVTALFCLQMSFTAYAQLRLPQVAAMFTHLASAGHAGERMTADRRLFRRKTRRCT